MIIRWAGYVTHMGKCKMLAQFLSGNLTAGKCTKG
jgi:hypothetical protein